MDPKIKTLWITALRSGQYRQGRGRLRSPALEIADDRYCCLGVLSELAVQNGIIPPIDRETSSVFYGVDGDRSDVYLPVAVCEWAGMEFQQESVLSHLNDTKRASFAEIADYIEENY